MTFAAEILEGEVEIGPENAEDGGGDDDYISGMDSLNDDEHQGNFAYLDIAAEASANGWDRETEAKVQKLANQLERMPTPDEIARMLDA